MIRIFSTKKITPDLIQKADEGGILITSENFIAIRSVEEKATLERIKTLASEKNIVIFTSANAVKSVFTRISPFPDWQFFCIGGKTRDTLIPYIVPNRILADAPNGKALAEQIISQSEHFQKVIFFCGNKRMADIPEALAKHQIPLEEVTVYETVATPQKVEGTYDGILFFSPSAVDSFFSTNKIKEQTILYAIGHTTENRLKEMVKNRIVVAPFPKMEQVINTVISYFKQR